MNTPTDANAWCTNGNIAIFFHALIFVLMVIGTVAICQSKAKACRAARRNGIKDTLYALHQHFQENPSQKDRAAELICGKYSEYIRAEEIAKSSGDPSTDFDPRIGQNVVYSMSEKVPLNMNEERYGGRGCDVEIALKEGQEEFAYKLSRALERRYR